MASTSTKETQKVNQIVKHLKPAHVSNIDSFPNVEKKQQHSKITFLVSSSMKLRKRKKYSILISAQFTNDDDGD